MTAKYKTVKQNNKGFTLIELIIVSALVVIIGTYSIVVLFSWRQHQTLSSTAEKIATVLREAISKSKTQAEGAKWGVRFINPDSSTGERPYFIIFRPNPSDPSSIIEVSRHPLPSSIKYDENDLGPGSQKEFIFEQISGELESGQKDSIKVLLVNNEDVSSTITVYPIGLITYISYKCSIGGCVSTQSVIEPDVPSTPPSGGGPFDQGGGGGNVGRGGGFGGF